MGGMRSDIVEVKVPVSVGRLKWNYEVMKK